ncbi:MAG: hypothetical protein Q4D32_07085 [Eubacteriales bacterium]|nr:hypothetical protein [Eubacteriales bacterium]
MAVHFSEEEKKKLEKNEAEIYKKRSKESVKQEWENFTWKEKLQNFQYYYLKPCLIALIIVAMVGLQVYDYFTKDTVALFITIQNEVLTDETIENLEKELSEYLHFRKGEVVRINQATDNYQIQTYLYSGTTDIIIASESDFSEWAESDYLFNQNVHEEVSFYADYSEEYRFYSKIITGEDVRQNTTDTDIQPSDQTNYYCGISLKDSEKYKQIGGMISDPVAGISCASKHTEEAKMILQYFMDNSQKLETKAVVK